MSLVSVWRRNLYSAPDVPRSGRTDPRPQNQPRKLSPLLPQKRLLGRTTLQIVRLRWEQTHLGGGVYPRHRYSLLHSAKIFKSTEKEKINLLFKFFSQVGGDKSEGIVFNDFLTMVLLTRPSSTTTRKKTYGIFSTTRSSSSTNSKIILFPTNKESRATTATPSRAPPMSNNTCHPTATPIPTNASRTSSTSSQRKKAIAILCQAWSVDRLPKRFSRIKKEKAKQS